MPLPDKIRGLRKERGLSQEQLAEVLDVSRQAISKWESGQSVPDTDKLLALSGCFDVTTDYLLKDGQREGPGAPEGKGSRPPILGVVLCAAGAVLLCFWGVVTALGPEMAAQVDRSSALTIHGTGLLLLLCAAAFVTGAVLLLRGGRK